jgi:hypothetical protein
MGAASKLMEETMKLWTLSELRRFSPAELKALYVWFSNALALYPEDYEIALTNLRNIRIVLARYDHMPRPAP